MKVSWRNARFLFFAVMLSEYQLEDLSVVAAILSEDQLAERPSFAVMLIGD